VGGAVDAESDSGSRTFAEGAQGGGLPSGHGVEYPINLGLEREEGRFREYRTWICTVGCS
jgi:hypothetical protein